MKIKRNYNNKKRFGELGNKKRYQYEKEEYITFLRNMEREVDLKKRPAYYDFYIDLLRKEVRYSSLLEINRGKIPDRFIYPFHRMSDVLLGYIRTEELVDVDIRENNLVSEPWNHDRYERILKRLRHTPFRYDKLNHMAIYYDGLNITCAYNGYHSLGTAVYLGGGIITAEYYDVTKIFDFVDSNDDLSFTYNYTKIIASLTERGIDIPVWFDREAKKRFYGTDYRMMLIYELSKRRWLCQD